MGWACAKCFDLLFYFCIFIKKKKHILLVLFLFILGSMRTAIYYILKCPSAIRDVLHISQCVKILSDNNERLPGELSISTGVII